MSKKNSAIKNLTEAHGWLGVVFSIVLFIVFWAGSLSLFLLEINQWAELPHYPPAQNGQVKPLSEIIDTQLKQYPHQPETAMRIFLPNQDNVSYRVFLQVPDTKAAAKAAETTDNIKTKRLRLKVDPKTGEARPARSEFKLINFIYRLHYDLQLSRFGLYFVGIVTLFLLFALFSGVFIHFKKIINYFFSYRTHKTRTQLLDLHNVVGIMSLPFTLMYAISGLVFNLVIVFQIVFVVFIYQGDQDKMISDAGFSGFEAEAMSGRTLDMSKLDQLLADKQAQYGPARFVRIYNYGDETAAVELFGKGQGNLEPRYELAFRLLDGKLLQESGVQTINVFKEGRRVLSSLHFGDFAGFDLRVLYFILGMAVAAMIIAGNMLWINKRRNNRKVSDKVTTFVSNLTLGSCCGMIFATAAGLLLERTLPLGLAARGDWVIAGFMAITVATAACAFWLSDKKRYIANTLYTSAAILILTVIASWSMFANTLIELWAQGIHSVIGVDIGLLLSAALCGFIAWRLRPLSQSISTQTQHISEA